MSLQKVLFVGGVGRSGSTLIERLLNEVDGVYATGETLHLWERGVRADERCGCGVPFSECPHWQEVGQRAFGGWDQVDLDRVIGHRYRIDRSRRLPQIMAAHRGRPLSADARWYTDQLATVLLAASETMGGAEVLLESSKHLSTATLLSLHHRLDLRVLHLTRDPRGVAYSWTKEVARPEADDLMPVYRPSRSAARWVTDNLGFRSLAKLGVPMLTMRYEDFVADPTTRLRQICQFVDLEPAGFPFLDRNQAVVSKPMHSVAGNPMRFGGAELTLREDVAWQTMLPAKDRRIVTAITRPVLGHFGYRARPWTRA